MTTELTQRQREILEYIRLVLGTQGMSPTVQEIQRQFGFRSPNAVQTHLQALHKKGFIERRGRTARSLRVLGEGEPWGNGGYHANWRLPLYQRGVGGTFSPLAGTSSPKVEMGVDTFFNAKHRLADELDGEIHAHSWRLRAVVSLTRMNRTDPSFLELVRDALEEELSDVEGAVLNDFEPFSRQEPTLEHMASWIGAKIGDRLNAIGAQLLSTTLWDHPTQYVTIVNGDG